tara:strand:+ start:161 stop:733 length:573 start_codon:yes stop_codon:yes gene_type:complete
MLKHDGLQRVISERGWSLQSHDRESMRYIDEYGNSFIFEVGRGLDSKYSIYFYTLEPVDPSIKLSDLQKSICYNRIRIALKFQGTVIKEEVLTAPKQKSISYAKRSCLYLEEISSFSSKEEYLRFKEFLDRQIKKGFMKEMEVNANYFYRDKTGGRWFKEILTNKYWRLLEPNNYFKGCWELVRKELIKK